MLDFSQDMAVLESSVHLNQAWEFYPSRFLEPNETLPSRSYPLNPGKRWNDLVLEDGTLMGSLGYGTYRMRFTGLPISPQGYVITTTAASAGRLILYVDGHPEETRAIEAGTVGVGDQEKPSKRSLILHFYARPDLTYTLLFQVSNYNQFLGGARWEVDLSENERGIQQRHVDGAINLLCIGVMIGLGIFSFLMWLRRPADRASLYLALASLMVSIRTIGTNPAIVQLFPDYWYAFLRKCEYLAMPGGAAVYLLYLRATFAPKLQNLWFKVLVGVGMVLSIACILLPHYWLTRSLTYFQIYVALTPLVWMPIVMRAYQRKHEGSTLVLIGTLFIASAIFFDVVLVARLALFEFFLTPIAVSVFLGLQAQAVALRSERQMRLAQRFAAEREDAQKALRIEVESRLLLASDMAHRLNNPMNYVLNGTAILFASAQTLHKTIEQLFDGSGDDSEVMLIKREFDRILDEMSQSLQMVDQGVRRSNGVVDEIRALSGVDGIAMNRSYFSELLEKALLRLEDNLGTNQKERFQLDFSNARAEFFSSHHMMIVALEQILRYVSSHSRGQIHIRIEERTPIDGRNLPIRFELTVPMSFDRRLWKDMEERLMHLLKASVTSFQSEINEEHLLIDWLFPLALATEPNAGPLRLAS